MILKLSKSQLLGIVYIPYFILFFIYIIVDGVPDFILGQLLNFFSVPIAILGLALTYLKQETLDKDFNRIFKKFYPPYTYKKEPEPKPEFYRYKFNVDSNDDSYFDALVVYSFFIFTVYIKNDLFFNLTSLDFVLYYLHYIIYIILYICASLIVLKYPKDKFQLLASHAMMHPCFCFWIIGMTFISMDKFENDLGKHISWNCEESEKAIKEVSVESFKFEEMSFKLEKMDAIYMTCNKWFLLYIIDGNGDRIKIDTNKRTYITSEKFGTYYDVNGNEWILRIHTDY